MRKFWTKKKTRKGQKRKYKAKGGLTGKQMKTVKRVAKKVAAKEDTRQSYQKTYKLQMTAGLNPMLTKGSIKPVRAILKYGDFDGASGILLYSPLAYFGTASVVVNLTNSCYDPSIPAGGHQPRGWDQLVGSGVGFLSYRVIKMKTVYHVTCNAYNETNTTTGSPAVYVPSMALITLQRCNLSGSNNYDSVTYNSQNYPYSLAELSGIKGTGVKLYSIPCDGKVHKLTMTTRHTDIYGKISPTDGWQATGADPTTYTFSHRLLYQPPNACINANDFTSHQCRVRHETYFTVELRQPVAIPPS